MKVDAYEQFQFI